MYAPSSGMITLTLTGGGTVTTTTRIGTTSTTTSSELTTTATSTEATLTTSTVSTSSGEGGGGFGFPPEGEFLAIVALIIAGSYALIARVSLARIVLRRTTAKTGLALIAFIILLTLYGLYLDPYAPRAFPCLFSCPSLPPLANLAHPFGTYATGQDVFSEVAHGAPIDLAIGFEATAVAVLIGTVVGLLAGSGKWIVRDLLLAFIQIVLLLPAFAIVVWVYRTYGNTELFLSPLLTGYLALLLGLFAWPPVALVVRNAVESLQQAEFVTAARALGAGQMRVIFRHILPNIITSVVSIASIVFAANVTAESLFAYLGLIEPSSDVVTWGFLLWEGDRVLFGQWWVAFFPGLMIVITVLGFALLGDAISETLNPKIGRGV